MINAAEIFIVKDPVRNLGSGEYQINWQVPVDLPYFDGHFPNMPLLPAVAIIDASLEFLRLVTGQTKHLGKLISAKFLGPIYPELPLVINFLNREAEFWTIRWCSREKLLAELRMTSIGSREELIDKS